MLPLEAGQQHADDDPSDLRPTDVDRDRPLEPLPEKDWPEPGPPKRLNGTPPLTGGTDVVESESGSRKIWMQARHVDPIDMAVIDGRLLKVLDEPSDVRCHRVQGPGIGAGLPWYWLAAQLLPGVFDFVFGHDRVDDTGRLLLFYGVVEWRSRTPWKKEKVGQKEFDQGDHYSGLAGVAVGVIPWNGP